MSLKAQTHFHTIHTVWVITPDGATQRFGMLIFLHDKTSAPPPASPTLSMLTHAHPPSDETPTLTPISALTTPYASAPPPNILLGLQSLRS
ncbi:hypothetical protein O181_121564 [Austropuccinia psidii MF-1]|uniref:Uncharacterized protein n=1 Tax=Austropuccinia psidii MF-1 TaxID=1389203 RepID=A0A9Q3KIW1_9BASI|nr:hypothetical protein [Austropuccinia psidii MF-1]